MKQGRILNSVIALLVVLFLVSCSDSDPKLMPLDHDAVILAFGDSLTFGSGANPKTQSYPAVLQQLTKLDVINSGIPGEISRDGLDRLPDVLEQVKPDLVILCHGGNDLIRKLGTGQLKDNLEQMIALIQTSGAQVVLIGVPQLGLTLTVPDLYEELSETYNIPIELEILPELESNPKVKSDHIHPNATGYKLFAQSINILLQQSEAITINNRTTQN
ncbi:MAG: arylesterase [Gammaproteobacteria bacterium]|nr:MAG: arylesterase [Gammaproteobacteria bacterium]RKZ95858.1 MAG: arylesterase [Gammaproteobacteria bacterium]RLA00691.1 MAG: arylesterase [Gammaproteobacteria bacterium]HHA18880.1 arylesterase [Methylophaga sp.]